MRRLVWFAVAMALTGAFAVAQSFTMQGAWGFGTSGPADSDQPNAFFAFQVNQFTYGERSHQWGWFGLTTRQDNQYVQVTMTRLEELTIDTENRTATFSGSGYYFVRSRSGFERVRGTVVVSVADNRAGNGEGDPDTLEVTFYDSEGNAVFTYSGEVKRGDIRVFSYSRSR